MLLCLQGRKAFSSRPLSFLPHSRLHTSYFCEIICATSQRTLQESCIITYSGFALVYLASPLCGGCGEHDTTVTNQLPRLRLEYIFPRLFDILQHKHLSLCSCYNVSVNLPSSKPQGLPTSSQCTGSFGEQQVQRRKNTCMTTQQTGR